METVSAGSGGPEEENSIDGVSDMIDEEYLEMTGTIQSKF